MTYRTAIGQVTPGTLVEIARKVVSNDPVVAPLGAVATVSILDGMGNLVTAVPATILAISAADMPSFSAFTAYDTHFSLAIPDTLPGTPEGLPYTAMLEFSISHAGGTLVLPAVQEAFTVIQAADRVLGPLSQVVIEGELSAQLSYNYTVRPVSGNVSVGLYLGNTSKGVYSDVFGAGTWDGSQFNYQFDATQLRANLMPHAALWDIDGVKEIAPIFVINPSVYMAMRELHDYVNKNCSDWATRELTFVPEQLIGALWNGACMFNSEVLASDITMLNAQGPVRNFWIQYSAVWLLQSQVLNGIETDFSYSNASVTLDVDRASKYQQFADALEASLRERLRPVKVAMAKRGHLTGDGSANIMSLRHGAIGTVGLSLSPVAKASTMWNPLSWRSMLLGPGNPSLFNQF